LESSWRLNWWRLGANNYFGPFQDRGFPFRLCAQMLDFPDRWLTNVSFFGTRYNFALFVPLGPRTSPTGTVSRRMYTDDRQRTSPRRSALGLVSTHSPPRCRGRGGGSDPSLPSPLLARNRLLPTPLFPLLPGVNHPGGPGRAEHRFQGWEPILGEIHGHGEHEPPVGLLQGELPLPLFQ
jgi:hypothetical protein